MDRAPSVNFDALAGADGRSTDRASVTVCSDGDGAHKSYEGAAGYAPTELSAGRTMRVEARRVVGMDT